MPMRVLISEPPMMEEIDRRFDVRGKPVVFAWGDIIYNPRGSFLGSALMAHEGLHGSRQGRGDAQIRRWWERYIEDDAFRLAEEIPAHRAEYHALCQSTHDRNWRARYLQQIAAKLAAPLYGCLLTEPEARRRLIT